MTATDGPFLRCIVCADAIGVYEPFVVLEGETARDATWLTLQRAAGDLSALRAAHRACHERTRA